MPMPTGLSSRAGKPWRTRIVTAVAATAVSFGVLLTSGTALALADDGLGSAGSSGSSGSSGSAGSSGSSDLVLPVPTTEGLGALAAAFVQTGKPYLWGGVGPNAFDCSGLVQWAYRTVGVTLPRTSQQMAHVGRSVPLSMMMPGDIIIFHKDASHVGIYAGFGQVFNAYGNGVPIGLTPLTAMPPIKTIRRV